MKVRPILAALAATALSSWAGAQTPLHGPRTLPAGDCAQLATDIGRAEDARRAALDEGENAWKAIVPFVVHITTPSSAVMCRDGKIGPMSACNSSAHDATREITS